jgi:hypothetical protein
MYWKDVFIFRKANKNLGSFPLDLKGAKVFLPPLGGEGAGLYIDG